MQPIHVLLIFSLASLGCQFMLPRQSTDVESQWEDFNQAKAAYDQIIIGETTAEDLAAIGFDPYQNDNVDIETYVDVFERFIPNDAMRLEDQHPGIQECIAARTRCEGYRVETFRETGREYGSFWLNFLLIREQTEVDGWYFESVIVLVDDQVVYKLWEGNPSIVKRQDKIRPLGPFQDIDVSVKLSFP